MEQTTKAKEYLIPQSRRLEAISITTVLDNLHAIRSTLSRITYEDYGENDRYYEAKMTLYKAHQQLIEALLAPLTESEQKALSIPDDEPLGYDPECGF
ncbi:hypothetical protein [Rothia amarae]|uniref:hypothetical protein n=1 Tax=Rothia amarae TaxID=169480 RepID=UPI0033FB2A23